MKTREEYIKKYQLETIMSQPLLMCLKIKYFGHGEYLMHANRELSELLFIVDGYAKTIYTTNNGENTLHSFLAPFTIVGDVELLGEQLVINDVIAVSDTVCLSLSLQYKEMFLKNTDFVLALAKELSNKLARSNHNKSVSMTYPVINRLASYICANMIEYQFSQNLQDAAGMIGCSYRQLQRSLQALVQQGIIQKKQKGVYKIIDTQALQQLGNDVYIL